MPPLPVIIDTDVLLGLIKSGRIDMLGKLTRFKFFTTDVNAYEVKVPHQQQVLAHAVANGWIAIAKLEHVNALQTFAQMQQWQLDDGEAAVVAQALHMNARVAMHDGAGRKAARVKLGAGQAHRLADVIVEALREKILTLAECDAIITSLRAQGDYRFDALKSGFAPIASDQNFGIPP